MAECINKITENIEFDCDDKPIAGVENQIELINRDDIDLAATTFDVANPNLITNLVLKEGAQSYRCDTIKGLFAPSTVPSIEDESINGHVHSLGIRIFKNSPAAHAQIDKIVDGANLVAVIEAKQKGANNANAFDVLGWHVGLEASADSAGRVYREQDGAYLLTIATPNGYKEPKSVYKWLETDYATTKEKFDNSMVTPDP